jgi:hypothetical protein
LIALRYDTAYFDLDDRSSITLEAESPAFRLDAIPGLKVYRFELPASRTNRALLSYADQLSRSTGFRVLDGVNMEIMGLHYRKGKLQLEQSGPRGYRVSFMADTGDVAAILKETSLRGLDLGTEAVSTSPNTAGYPTRSFCYATVKNPLFYGDANPDFSGYVNYFDNNAFQVNTTTNQHCLTPFVFVRSVLDAIAGLIGYRQEGAWLDNINNLCIYSNIALDQLDGAGLNVYQSSFALQDHLPDMSCAAFLQGLRSLFGLMVNIDSNRQLISYLPLSELVSDTDYQQLNHAAVAEFELQPYALDGYRLSMGMDSTDELYKRKSQRTFYYEQGAQEMKVGSQAGTLYMLTEDDPRNPGSQWTIPQAEQPGTSDAFELENEGGLRLLWYHGLQDGYFQASPYGDTYDLSYGSTDERNLHDTAWTQWLRHTDTPSINTRLNLRMNDLLRLDFAKKIMMRHNAFLIEKYSLPVNRNGLGTAKVKLRKVKY